MWVQKCIKLLWINHHKSFFFSDKPFFYNVNSNLKCSLSCAFAVSCLKHQEIGIVAGIIALRAALTFLIHWEIREEEKNSAV